MKELDFDIFKNRIESLKILIDWAKSFEPYDTVGYCGDHDTCPVAAFVKSQGISNVYVTPECISFYPFNDCAFINIRPPSIYHNLTDLISKVDALGDEGDPVTADEFIHICEYLLSCM